MIHGSVDTHTALWAVHCIAVSNGLSFRQYQKGREQADLNTVRETELEATPSSFKAGTSGQEGALANNVPSLSDNKTHVKYNSIHFGIDHRWAEATSC